MKYQFTFAVFLLALQAAVFCQNNGIYSPLVCQGQIPEDFLTVSSEKYQTASASIENENFKRKEEKSRKAFALETNFVLDDLLHSGLVLFNDEVTNYLNDVVKILISQDPALQNRNIRVYTIRSEEVNAFATDRGDLFVTIGLLAQLEDEAQLAYILSHELVHTREGHSLQLFLNKDDLNRRNNNRDVLRETVFNDEMMAHCAYSKELELDADKLGLQLFLKTNYDPSTLGTVYDVLKYSYLPFDDEPFDPEFLQSDKYRFPESYAPEQINPIAGESEDADDSNSTHPNIRSRRIALRSTLKDAGTAGKQQYLVSSERFKRLREAARFELPMLYLGNDRLADAIYSSYLLLRKHPGHFYLKKCIAKALYMDAKFKNDDDFYFDYDPEEVEGESHRVHFLLEKLKAAESTVLALRYALSLQEEQPDDTEINTIVKDLFIEMAQHHDSPDDFYTEIPVITEELLPETPAVQDSTAERSKYDKIRSQKTLQPEPETVDYWRYAFAGQMAASSFHEKFGEGQSEYKKRKENEAYWETREGKSAWRKRLKKIKKKGMSLGIEKIVVVSPYFRRLEKRRDIQTDYLRSESGEFNINRQLVSMASKAGLDATLLDPESLDQDDVATFNDIRFLNEWYSEQVEHFDLSLTPGYNQQTIDGIAEKYGADYFLWTGVVSVKKPRPFSNQDAAVSILFPIALPFIAVSKLKGDYYLLYYAILFDVKTGRRQVVKFEYFKRKDTNNFLRGHFYDTFSQIKAGK